MPTDIDNTAAIDNQDAFGIGKHREAVGDYDDSAAVRQCGGDFGG